jgi:acyl-coenzyme A synthetase/AMP-(fatty) acid ligase
MFQVTDLAQRKLNQHLFFITDVSEAAVVGYPHDIKGQGLYAYVTLNKGTEQKRIRK